MKCPNCGATGSSVDEVSEGVYKCHECLGSFSNSDIESPVRVNVKISKRANDWLDKKSKEMALSKSGLISLAVENYIKENEVVHGLPKLLAELEKHGIKI